MQGVAPVHFRSAAAFRRWLARHHADTTELWVGFYKKHTGKVGITYGEALDQALCKAQLHLPEKI